MDSFLYTVTWDNGQTSKHYSIVGCLLLGACWTGVARAFITTPVPILGAAVSDSTYVTVIKVEKVSRDKVLAKLAEVRDKLK